MPARAPRADAHRNREKLLKVAVQAFSRGKADVSLDSIAKKAGVGIGTLYRHFPTRASLIEAAYRTELWRLCDSAKDLLAASAPDVALRQWMERFVLFLPTKRGISEALRTVISSDGTLYEESRGRMLETITLLVTASAAAGLIRSDVEPYDILTSLGALSRGTTDEQQSARLLDLLMDGLRYRG